MKEKNFNIGMIKINSIDNLSQASIGKNQKESVQTTRKKNMLMRQFADRVSLVHPITIIDDRDLFDELSQKRED